MKEQQLLFVYNANSDLFSSVSDFAHKMVSPSTYKCNLCALTYGNFSVKQEWKYFVETLSIKTTFLHKDEFIKQFKSGTALPAIFIQTSAGVQEIISQSNLNNCKSLEDLRTLVTQKLEAYVQHHHSNL